METVSKALVSASMVSSVTIVQVKDAAMATDRATILRHVYAMQVGVATNATRSLCAQMRPVRDMGNAI
jgi:hypothetical protein